MQVGGKLNKLIRTENFNLTFLKNGRFISQNSVNTKNNDDKNNNNIHLR